MDRLLKFWPIVVGTVAAGSVAVQLVLAVERHQAADAQRDERIRVLERVMLSEHPEYTLVIYSR